MNHDMYVISLVTTGEEGYPQDEVVEVAICGLDTERMDIESVYSSTIFIPAERWTDERRRYVMEHHGLGQEELVEGREVEKVAQEVKGVLQGQVVTSFNVKSDFFGHLLYEPWDLTGEASIAPSINLRSAEACRIPLELRDGGNMLTLTYEAMFPYDPAQVDGGHRALDDALRASTILLELRRAGRY
ncbi:MAG: exonuclease domain-containing protein [Candidatus Methanomethylophilaceae archaeon]|jgi:hypothetical protein